MALGIKDKLSPIPPSPNNMLQIIQWDCSVSELLFQILGQNTLAHTTWWERDYYRSQFQVTVYHGREGKTAGAGNSWSTSVHLQKIIRNAHTGLSCPAIFLWVWDSGYQTFGEGILPPWSTWPRKCLKYGQRPISQMILDFIKL